MANAYQNYNFNQQQPTQQTQIPNLQMAQYAQMPQQSFFLQPVGNIYNLNTASDISNVPAGANISVGLCLSENIMYIKSFQNGAPMLLGYRLSPIEGTVTSSGNTENETAGALKEYDERIGRIEDQISKIRERLGGKIEWQI